MVSSFAGPSPAHIQEPIWICDSMGWRAAASPGSSQQLLAIVEPATVQRENWAPNFLFGWPKLIYRLILVAAAAAAAADRITLLDLG